MNLKLEWANDNEKEEKWLPYGTKYQGNRYIVWDWYISHNKVKTIFRAYSCKSEALNYYNKLLLDASNYGGLARRLGVRRMPYKKVLNKSKVIDHKTGKTIRMPKRDGCSHISWERANQLVFEI